MTGSVEEFSKHIGRKTVVEDLITAAQVERLAATLDRGKEGTKPGDPLPPGWQPLFFRHPEPTAALARDAAPVEMDDTPESPLPIRMFAGNVMHFRQPLRIGEVATKERELISVTPKEGRSGKMVFAVYLSRYSGSQGLAIEEEQTMVFREEDTSGGAKKLPAGEPGPTNAAWKRSLTPNEAFLFRYSAVTFNTHRIHYDRTYATEVEGYPDLLVHGPLTATLLLDLARDSNPDQTITSFQFQARAPLFVNRPLSLMGEPDADGKSCQLWAVSSEGTVAMKASAEFG